MEKKKILDQVRESIRLKHYSIRTEHAYVNWIRIYILFHHKKHSKNMGATEIRQFLSYLAIKGKVSASLVNLSSLVFFNIYTSTTQYYGFF